MPYHNRRMNQRSENNSNTTNRVTRQNEFINRRTGQPVPAGTMYHIHPEKGAMEGGTHNPNIEGGTAGHDFFDRTSNSIQGICPPGFVLQGGNCVPKYTTTQGVMSNCPPGQYVQPDGSCSPLRPSTGPTMPYRGGTGGGAGRHGKNLLKNKGKLVNNHTTLIRNRTGKGDEYIEAPNPRYQHQYNNNQTPIPNNNQATIQQVAPEPGNPQRIFRITGTAAQMASAIMEMPGAKQQASSLGITLDSLTTDIVHAGNQNMGWTNTRFPSCMPTGGGCNGSGLCLGLGCMDKCRDLGSSSNQMNWEFGGGFGDGNSNTNWNMGITYSNTGNQGSLSCNIGISW